MGIDCAEQKEQKKNENSNLKIHNVPMDGERCVCVDIFQQTKALISIKFKCAV